ncbi:potassium transporter TrkA [Thermococcus sp. M39]|uniref:TrkA C-terminal domain-containing protein n=2 Tax=unclassified Thermococcus TaxID=2627626 RepID=UPI00143BD6CB|nr:MULTISPECIES: TrkA C-terminal domain-containing protein [unclassified Thermococcus]NJE07085.1 potassium transporter TrkA [Thermococcus sp. M39]NJE13623.1 potassium transporter TrkA [Thermococcus sp. LS2]
MIALISFLLVILVSIIIVRIGAVALEMTGLSRDVAAFQAQSAFSGTGFTTSESEYVVSHPVRRKIIRILIFLGSAGITSAIATLVLTFIGKSGEEAKQTFILLLGGLMALYLFVRSKWIDKMMRKIIRRALNKFFPSLKIYDYNQLLGISRGYSIAQIKVKKNSWLANKTLRELQLDKEGVLVLGIYRKVGEKEVYLGAPSGDTKIVPGDLIVLYGPEDVLLNLSKRVKGIKGRIEHEEAVEKAKLRAMQEEMELEGE